MASKILNKYFTLIIFIGAISSINSKAFNYQQQGPDTDSKSSEHQVLFQKIGSYAATVQYLHVVIPIPLAETIEAMVKMSDELGTYQKDQLKAGNPLSGIMSQIIKRARERIASDIHKIYNIIDTLPPDHQISKRQILEFLSTALGGVGTLMGLFNSYELQRIAAGVGENRKKINSIIDIQKLTTDHLKNLQISVDKLSDVITALLQTNPAQLLSEISDIHAMGNDVINRITNMVQQAQNKRLSVDLLTAQTLTDLFDHLQDQADKQDLTLLISQPSDLFQIDTSYLHGNKTVTLILHVPMVAENNKLNLLQFIPFPLSQSLGANTTVTPKVDKDLIAVGADHQYKILGQTDLAACTKLGHNFLCEGRSVLRTDLEDSCLGALYLHNLPGTLKNCQFELGETREHVFQTGPTQWLVSAPDTFTSVMQCEKSHETIFIKPLSSITVNPGCKLRLRSHVIQPDTNQRQTYEIRHHSWNWNIENLFPTSNMSEIANELIELRRKGNYLVSATDLQQIQKFTEAEITEWFSPNYLAIGFFIIFALMAMYLAYRIFKWWTKKELQPLDVALQHLDRKERMEYLQLKQQIAEYETDLQENHPSILKIGQKKPKGMNMADYTVETPTHPVAPTVYPEINEHPTQY